MQTVEKELKAISRFQLNYPEPNTEGIYKELHKERQKLVQPIREPDDEYIRRWEDIEYIGKPIDETVAELYTAKGERVRSKSEVIIADTLNREGISYRYEYPIQLKGYGKVYPDFTILNISLRKEIYWEHLGMMDDEEYAEKAVRKINNYIQNGIFPGDNLILTYETKKIQLNQKLIRLMINQYLR